MPKISLAKGGFALVDDIDVELVSQYRWHLNNYGYAIAHKRNGARCKPVLMHRLLLAAHDGVSVDHINHDTLDNRRGNLRECSHADNMKNRKMHRNNKVGLKGVYVDRRNGVYRAQIRFDGRKISIGSFNSATAAHAAYLEAAKKYHGQFANAG